MYLPSHFNNKSAVPSSCVFIFSFFEVSVNLQLDKLDASSFRATLIAEVWMRYEPNHGHSGEFVRIDVSKASNSKV